MEYQKKYQKQKTWFTLAVAAGILMVVMAVGFVISAATVSDNGTKSTPTPLPTATLEPYTGEIRFVDSVLENAIKNQLGITGDITVADMEKLEVLEFTEKTVTDLEGLQAATNLKELKLKIDIVRLDPILELYIEKLTFVSDHSVQPLLEDIAKMERLKYLDLSFCGITVVGYISELEHLETLILDDNRIVGLNYLNTMSCLKYLSMKNCGIKDITDFRANTSIEYINLDDNLLESVETLGTMLSLKESSYESNPIKKQ